MDVYKDDGDIIIKLSKREKSSLHDSLWNYLMISKKRVELSNSRGFSKQLKDILREV